MMKGDFETDAWAEGTRVYLRVPLVGATKLLWVDLYEGPTIHSGNFDSVPVEHAVRKAKTDALALAARWRSMSFDSAQAEYEAI